MITTTEILPIEKLVKPINFIFHRAETTVDQLANFLPVAKDLQREAVEKDLRITGPVHWHYFGFSGDVTKPFVLEVALPVEQIPAEYDGAFHFKRTEPFECVSLVHEGAWHDLPVSYGKLMNYMQQKGLTPIGVTRELYVNADLIFPDANVTEIQMGIA